MATNEEIKRILEIKKKCECATNECDHGCRYCPYGQDLDKLIETYDEVIYKLDMFSEFEKEYRSVVSEYQDLSEENDKLRKEVRKRRREKRKWKRRALMYKDCLETMRDRVRAINNKLKGDKNNG